MDEVAVKRFDTIEKDLTLSWELLRSLPDLDTVRAVLPDSLGVELATMQLRAEHGLQASPPDYELLHSMFENIVKNLPVYREIRDRLGLTDAQCAHVGDDLPDVALFEHVGLACAPADAHDTALEKAHFISRAVGGRGAVRDVIDLLLAAKAAP